MSSRPRAQLIIPMSGISSRFTRAGFDRPKTMVEVEGQTILDHVFDMFPGWDDVLCICNEDHLDDPRWDLRARILARRPRATIVAIPPHRRGPGWAVQQAAQHIARDRPVVVNYCDFTCHWDADDFLEQLSSGAVDASLAVYRGFHPHSVYSSEYGYPRLEGDRVTDVREKQPWTDSPMQEFASSGTFGFSSGDVLLRALSRQITNGDVYNGEYYLSLTCKNVLEAGLRVGVYEIQHFMQWGTPEDLADFEEWSWAAKLWAHDPPEAVPGSYKIILAAGAGDRFAANGYPSPKPVLPIVGHSQLEHAFRTVPGESAIVVTRSDLADHGLVADVARARGADVVELPRLSRGQAESARAAVEVLCRRPEGPVTISACDAAPITSTSDLQVAVDRAGDRGMVVWTFPPHRAARQSPEQFVWVSRDAHKRIDDVWLKRSPAAPGARVVFGAYTFPGARGLLEDIDALIADDDRLNGEFYLDSLIARYLGEGRPVISLDLVSAISYGTPEEYETFKYWLSCFHKWPHHPYSLATDRSVDAVQRADLDREFRSFDPYVTGRSTS